MQEHRGGLKLYFNLHISFPVLLLPLHLTPYLQSDQVPFSSSKTARRDFKINLHKDINGNLS